MKIKYDFYNYSLIKNKNNSDNLPCLPFKMNYHMFRMLVEKNDLTLSEMYDRFFLCEELYNRMCSMCLREYMSSKYYNSLEVFAYV